MPDRSAAPPRGAAAALHHRAGYSARPAPVYFDLLEPASGTPRGTVMMVHGGAHTGSCYLRTADGRPGWAYRFAEAGYRVAVPDWPGTGRSGHVPLDDLTGAVVAAGLGGVIEALGGPVVLMTHSMSGAYGWRLLETHGAAIEAVVGVAPAQPGNIQAVPPVARETEDFVELAGQAVFPRLDKRAPALSSRIFVEKKLVGDSRHFPRPLIADYAASLLAIPPRLVYERLNIGGSQLKIGRTECLRGKRVLVLTGTDDLDHPRALDSAIVDWLNAAGARAEFLWLGDAGIEGNGHMLMLEGNSDAIARIILDWLDRR
jgi:pimeloyl-ACP methyl ester carboxylesterase